MRGVGLSRRFVPRDDARLALVRVLPRVSSRLSALVTVVVLVGALLSSGFTYVSGQLVGAVPEALRGGIESPGGRSLLVLLVLTVAVFVVMQALNPVRELLAEMLGRRLEAYLQGRVMGTTLRPTGVAHLEDPGLLDLISRTRSVALGQYTPEQALRGLVDLVVRRLQAVGAALLLAVFFDPWIAAGLLGALLFIRARLRVQFLRVISVLEGNTGELRRSGYFLDLALSPGAAKETRVFGLGGWVVGTFRSHWLEAMQKLWAERRRSSMTAMPWTIALTFASLLVSFVLVGRAAVEGEIGLAALAICAQAILGMFNSIFSFNDTDIWLEYGATSVPAALEFERRASGHRLGGTRDAASMPEREIRLEGMSFSYPGAERPVYEDLDLTVPAGRSLAIVGENGAGKTTLIKLLCRLYDPTGGCILVDDTDLRDLDPVSWRRRVAVLFQDFVRYELSAADNVGFGAVDRLGDRDALQTAAHRAGAEEVLAGLPRGWDTMLSRRYEGGADLSGGQWQRLALARALLAVEAGAGVLVLDEPTASLDVRAEVEIFDRFLELTRGLTTLLISHRFSTVRRADAICVLEGGRIVEKGTHDELVARGGRYARMYELQASRFRDGAGP
jgi:ATP-binding cassette subfamily B protein